MLIILAKQQKSDGEKNKCACIASHLGELTLFLRVVGNARHHEGHLRHDGKMHIPCPQRGNAPSACRSILSGKCAGRSLHCTANISHSKQALEKRLHLFHLPFSPTEDGQEQRRSGDHRRVHRLLPKCKLDIATHLSPYCWHTFFFSLYCFLFVHRMKTSCDQCTSLKMFFNLRLTADDLEENTIFSSVQ